MNKHSSIEMDYTPFQKQEEAHEAPERYILYGGAIRGGKTKWLCAEAIKQSLTIVGNRGFLGRHRLVDLEKTTLRTLLEMLPQRAIYQHRLGDRLILTVNESFREDKIGTPSEIYYGGLGDYSTTKEMLGGLEFGWFGIDQAEEITERQFDLFTTRLTLKIPNVRYHGFMTANPAPGWLRDRFIDNTLPNHRFIPSLPKDNPHLPLNYEEELRRTLPSAMVAQLLSGDWDVDETMNRLIPYSQIRNAIQGEKSATGDKVAGVDISRYGDDETVFILRQGDKVLQIEAWEHQDTTFSAGRVARLIREYEPTVTYIDSVGIGAGVFDPLNNEGFSVVAVNVGEKALDTESFLNKRAEYFGLLAKRFENGEIDIPDHQKLASQLSGLKYKYDSKMRRLLASKEEMRKEGFKSPDYADALMLAFIDTTSEEINSVAYW